MAYGPGWKSVQVANPNVSGLMALTQEGINNAGDAGRGVLESYDAGQKLKNDAAVAQELAGIETPEQMNAWLKQGGLNGRNVSGASIEAMLGHQQRVAAAARALAEGSSGSPSGGSSRSGSGRSRSGSGTSTDTVDPDAATTNAVLALALGGTPTPTPETGATPVIRPQARPTQTAPAPAPTGPAPFVPGATSTEIVAPDFSSLSDEDLAAEIAALGG